MYDMHYDLLTILYCVFNKKINIDINYIKKIYDNNIIGGIVNLYFMSKQEKKEQLNIEYFDVTKMFKESIGYLEILKQNNIISKDINFIYSIEGCDYLNDILQLEHLYKLGLRSILPVWNEENKFGSGIRSDKGLTELGKELIKKAIDLNMIIDVSHANEKTFDDILDIIEKEKYSNIIASHSNVKSLCDNKRNLSDEQLIRLKKLGGYIGLVGYVNFVSLDNENMNYREKQENFIKHLKYLIDVIKFPINKIFISSDDVSWNNKFYNKDVFNIFKIKAELFKLIEKNYSKEIANLILIENPKKLIEKVK